MDVFSQFAPELDSIWNNALSQDTHQWPFYTQKWHAQWFQSLGNGEQPIILADVPSNIVIPLAAKNGVAHFSGGEEISDYLDAIGPENAKAAVWQKTLALVRMQGAARLILRNIPEDSATLSFFTAQKGVTIEKEDTTPILSLPDSFDAYASALERKDRHELKRKIRKFEAAHPGAEVATTSGASTDMGLLLNLMRRDADKQLFLTDPMQQFFQNLPVTLGDLLTQFTLTIDGKVIATAIAFRTPKALLLYNSGYNDAYVGAGFYLKAKMIEWAISQGITTCNFLQGNERYKYELGGKDYFVYRVTLPL